MTTFLFLRYNQYFSSLVLAKRAVGKISIHFISFCGKQLQINILTKETLKQRIPCWCHIPYLRLISDLLPFPLKISHQALPTSSHQACLSSWQSHILLKIQSILGFLYHKQYFSLMFLRILTAGFLKNFSSSHPTSSLPLRLFLFWCVWPISLMPSSFLGSLLVVTLYQRVNRSSGYMNGA